MLRLSSGEFKGPFPPVQVNPLSAPNTGPINRSVWTGSGDEHTEKAGSLGLTTKPPWKRLKKVRALCSVLRFSRYSAIKAALSWSGPWRGAEPDVGGSFGGAGHKLSADVMKGAPMELVQEGSRLDLALQQLHVGRAT